MMIQVRDLSRVFAGVVALDAISFGVPKGQIVGLLGPNGAGKTTCMRILSGFIAPTSGLARIDGVDLCEHGLMARRFIGYLPEGAPLPLDLRVEEYLRFRVRLRRIARRRHLEEISRVMQACGVASVRRRIIGQLSRGFRQRVGLADALLGAPPLLLLDEPTAGLDPNQMRDVRELIRSLAGSHTVLLSSHMLAEVEALCQTVVILDRGRIVAQGSVEEVCRHDRADALVLELRAPKDIAERRLRCLQGVKDVHGELLVDVPGTCRLRVYGRLDDHAAERVAAAVAAEGWGLRALRRERVPLVEVFSHLTRGDIEDPS